MTDPVRREAYVQWVVQGAIETGIAEGYPLRDPRALEDQLRREEGVPPRVSRTEHYTTQTESKLQGIRPAEIEALQARFEAVAPQLSATARDQIQDRLHELRSDQHHLQPTLAQRADRLADLLEEAQRQGLVVTGKVSEEETLERERYGLEYAHAQPQDQKQRQRY
jgi:septal ring factor EnvC (AmiA/AmiB activator)